jgi:hypothetical protein
MRRGAAPRRAAAVVLTILAAGAALAAEPGFRPIGIEARPIRHFLIGSDETRFGWLRFRGGLELSSADPDFGALSGLDFAADGITLYAVTDTGFWFTARLVEDDGAPTGLDRPAMAPMLDVGGAPLAGKVNADAEGLRLVAGADGRRALVSFERRARVHAYAGAPDFAPAPARELRLPGFVDGVRANQGLEAIAAARGDGPLAGAIVVIAERSLDKRGNHRAFVLDGPRAGAFSISRFGGYDITDAAFMPDGDLLILERRFGMREGIGMRMRRLSEEHIRPGAALDGPVLIEADNRFQIDNMEGLAVRAGPNGETLVAMVSDDNHSLLQRTLLLEFVLGGAVPPMPRLRPQAAAMPRPSP